MSIRFLKLSLASPESIRSWTERILPNGKPVGKILKGDLIDYKNGLPIRDGLSCERIFGPMVSFTCTCGRFKCIETRGIHIVHDTLRSSRPIITDVSRVDNGVKVKQWNELASPINSSPNSTTFERKTKVHPRFSQNSISKPIKKTVTNEKPSQKVTLSESFEYSILQPLASRQKKMRRFLAFHFLEEKAGHLFCFNPFKIKDANFYYDYKSIYGFNKNEMVPFFVSIFEEPNQTTLVRKNWLKRQTVRYYSKKKQISESFNFFSPIKNVNSRVYLERQPNQNNLRFKTHRKVRSSFSTEPCLFSINGKQTTRVYFGDFKITMPFFERQNVLKSLYKAIFQIYIGFWFDLKVHYNSFVYEKHIFLWVPNRKARTLKVYHNFKLAPSFFNKFKLQGFYHKSQKFPTITQILARKATSNQTNFGDLNCFHTSRFLVMSNFLVRIMRSNILQKKNSFFFNAITTKKAYSNCYDRFLLNNISLKNIINFQQNKRSLQEFLTKTFIDWSQPHQLIELAYVFQFCRKLKFEKTKGRSHRTYLSNHQPIMALYFAKKARSGCTNNEKNIINTTNQKFSTHIGLLKKKSIFRLSVSFDFKKDYGITLNQIIPNKISLLIQKSILFNNQSIPILEYTKPLHAFLKQSIAGGKRYKKNANICFGLLKISSFDLKLNVTNPFQKVLSALKKKKPNSQLSIFKYDRKKSIAIFDSFRAEPCLFSINRQRHNGKQTNHGDSKTKISFKKQESLPREKRKRALSLNSSNYKPIQKETFLSKDKVDMVSRQGVSLNLNLTSSNYNEDTSKPYVGSNTKQNIRVYKFKNFPPEEIRYCPYCEVELLPNSIRRYRLGYIEFISPVTHIWYTASSIPLLLNLSKTMIEGIASCHEALSSGFPPVYKWSYNGESPTSWTFQMQPLRLPIHLVPKILPWDRDQVKRLNCTEIILGSNSIIYQNFKQRLVSRNGYKMWTPSFRIVYPELSWENNFTIYENRIKNPFFQNRKINDKELLSREKIGQQNNHELLLYNNLSFFGSPLCTTFKKLDLNRNSFSFRIPRILNNLFPADHLALQEKQTNEASFFKNVNSRVNQEKTNQKTLEKSFQAIKPKIDLAYLSFCKNLSYKFKGLWMFEYYCEKSLPKNNPRPSPLRSERERFIPISRKVKKMQKAACNPFKNSFDKQTWPLWEDRDGLYRERPLKPSSNPLTGFLALYNPLTSRFEPEHNLLTILNNKKYHYLALQNQMVFNKKKIAKQFLVISLLKSNHFGYFSSIDKRSLLYGFSMFNFPIKSFFDNTKKSFFIPYQKKLEIKMNNRPIERLFFMLLKKQIASLDTKGENGLAIEKCVPLIKRELATNFNISKETMREFTFFNQIPKKVDSHYDLYTATEYEKKREWLKLEGFFEDPSDKKVPRQAILDNSQVNAKIDNQTYKKDSLTPKHIRSWNETKEKTGSLGEKNDSESFDNLSLPLVLPFLGKNPDNIEFQSNYSNHEHFQIDPLKFIIHLFTTQHIWDQNSLNVNSSQDSNQSETNHSNNPETFLHKQKYNHRWNPLAITYNNSLTYLSNQSMFNFFNTHQAQSKKNKSILNNNLLKKFACNFSFFSPDKYRQAKPLILLPSHKYHLSKQWNRLQEDEKNQTNSFWPSLNLFSITSDQLFSKTYPFLPVSSQNFLFKDRLKPFFHAFQKRKMEESTNFQYKDDLLLLREPYLKKELPLNEISWVNQESLSNTSNSTNDLKKSQNYYFRKLGRNHYYFKLEEMTRLKNAYGATVFFKNLFYRNKFQITSIFYSHKVTSHGANSKIKLKTRRATTNLFNNLNPAFILKGCSARGRFDGKQSKDRSRNFLRAKPPFGFHLSLYGFNLVKPPSNRLLKLQYTSSWWSHYFPNSQIFWSIIKYNFPFFTRSIKIAKVFICSKENFKKSLWPLKLNTNSQDQKVFINNFDQAFDRNFQNIYRPTVYLKNSFQNNFLNLPTPLIINQISRPKWPYQNYFKNLKHTWSTDFKIHLKPKTGYQKTLQLFNPKIVKIPSILLDPAALTILQNNVIFGAPKGTPYNIWPIQNSKKQRSPCLFWAPNFEWEFKKQKSTLVGLPISVTYDFSISRFSSLIKNIPLLETKQLENEKQCFSILENLHTGIAPREKHLFDHSNSRMSLKQWTKNQNFPAINLNLNDSENAWLKTYLKNSNRTMNQYFLYWSSQNRDKTTRLKLFSNHKYYFFKRVQNQVYLNKQPGCVLSPSSCKKNHRATKTKKVINHFSGHSTREMALKQQYGYFLKPWSRFNQLINYQCQPKISYNHEETSTILLPQTKQKLNRLALLGFNSNKIEFFGSLKIYSKRRFLKIWPDTNQNLKQKIPFLFNRLKEIVPRDLKLNSKYASSKKHDYIDLINGCFPVIDMKKINSYFQITNLLSKIKTKNQDSFSFSLFNQKRSTFLWALERFFKKQKVVLNTVTSPVLKNINRNINRPESGNQELFFAKQKQLKTRGYFAGLNTNFLAIFHLYMRPFLWFRLHQNKEGLFLPETRRLPWKKLQYPMKKTRNRFTRLMKNKKQASSQIIKSLSLNHSYHLNSIPLVKLVRQPQITGHLNRTMKRHQNIICYTYAIETMQKQVLSSRIVCKSIKDFDFKSKTANYIQSLSLKISCFTYFGYVPTISLNPHHLALRSNKFILQKKSTYQPKIIIQKIPKQIPLGSFKKTSFVWKTKNAQGSSIKRPIFHLKKIKTINDINDIQLKYDLNLKIVNSPTFKECSYTPIFKWGSRTHMFDKQTDFSYKNNQNNKNQISLKLKSAKHNYKKNIEKNDSKFLFRTDNHFSSSNKTSHQAKWWEDKKMLSYSDSLIHRSAEKQKVKAWKANTNYYACISQMTSWGSDHGSWILFLKYIRANIYKGDQLLPAYFNKMNFQMMPRTGSIILQQLLSQLVLVPTALDLESNFISKQESVSEIDTWQNFSTSRTKDNSMNKNDQNLMFLPSRSADALTNSYFHYNSSFFSTKAILNNSLGLPNSNKSPLATPRLRPLLKIIDHWYPSSNGFLKSSNSLLSGQMFSIFDGLVFFKNNLYKRLRRKTIQMKRNNILSVMKKFTHKSHSFFPTYFSTFNINMLYNSYPAELYRVLGGLYLGNGQPSSKIPWTSDYKPVTVLGAFWPVKKKPKVVCKMVKQTQIELNQKINFWDNSEKFDKKQIKSKLLNNPKITTICLKNQTNNTFLFPKNNFKHKFFKANALKHNSINKYALSAYKIKKPVAYQRFRQIYELHSSKLNNWYRLNNFFSYSHVEGLPIKLSSVLSNLSMADINTFQVVKDPLPIWTETKPQILEYLFQTSKYKSNSLNQIEYQKRFPSLNRDSLSNTSSYRKTRIFDIQSKAIIPTKKQTRFRRKTYDSSLNGSMGCYSSLIGNDIRILKLIYSLIVSVKLQFLPTGKWEPDNARIKQYNHRYDQNLQTDPLLNSSFSSIISHDVSNKAINQYATNTISNRYYHLYFNKNKDLKSKPRLPKFSFISQQLTKENFNSTNKSHFNHYHNSFLQNVRWLRLYSAKVKNLPELVTNQTGPAKLTRVKNSAAAELFFGGSDSLFSDFSHKFISDKVIWPLAMFVKMMGAENTKPSTNRVFKPYLNLNYSEVAPREQFYFSNQKIKIYNILISPMEASTFRRLNFGFPTTPFDFIESVSRNSALKSPQNHKNTKLLALKSPKWFYTRPINDVRSEIQPPEMTPFNKVVSAFHSHQNNNLKINSHNLQKKQFPDHHHENWLKHKFKSILPINYETYKGQIQSEILFIKLKEIENYNVLLKKKNSLFKTLILKMNSALNPLLSLNQKTNKRWFPQNHLKLTKITSLNKRVAPSSIMASGSKNRGHIFLSSPAQRVTYPKTRFPLAINRQGKIANLSEEKKRWNQNLIFEKQNMFSNVNDYFNFNDNSQNGNFKKPKLLKQLQVSFVRSQYNKRYMSVIDQSNKDAECFFLWSKKMRKFKQPKQELVKSLDFFRIWLFLDSIHYSYLHELSNLQNKHNINLRETTSQLITKKLALYGKHNSVKFHDNHDFPKILQFYEYRKNFFLKKIFKQRIHLTQCKPLLFDQRLITLFKPIEPIQSKDIAHSFMPTEKWEPIIKRFDFFKNPPTTHRETINCLRLPFLKGSQAGGCKQQKNKSRKAPKYEKIWFRTDTLVNRRINCFYDQDGSLDTKYEFRPFGVQIKNNSTYSDWKKTFKPEIVNLNNNTFNSFKNHTQFRLLTIPQIFDLSNQNNLFSRMPKKKIPINLLGPLLFSSSIKSSHGAKLKRKLAGRKWNIKRSSDSFFSKKTERLGWKNTFPVLKNIASGPPSFWGTYNIFSDRVAEQDNEGKNCDSNLEPKNCDSPVFSFNKFELNETTRPENQNHAYTNVLDEEFQPDSIYFETNQKLRTSQNFIYGKETNFNYERPLSSETLFREENLKVSSSYKALLRKAKILEDYVVPDPSPIDTKLLVLKLLNGGVPRPIAWTLEGRILSNKISLFGSSYLSYDKINIYPCFYKNKSTQANSISWGKSKNLIALNNKLMSQFIWDGNQNRFKNLISTKSELDNSSRINQKINKNVFSMRDQTKFENQIMTNINDGTSGPTAQSKKQRVDKNDTFEPKIKSDYFFKNQENLRRKTRFKDQNFIGLSTSLKRKNSVTDLVSNFKSTKRNGIFNYGRNLRKLRLQYLRNFRRLRFIEYLKATYIKPEWMILSLLPVLPPDLRPVIANPRGYITGDINTHYQNVIYRSNNIEKLLDTFWIPKKFYSKKIFFNHQSATDLMLSEKKSYFHSIHYLTIDKQRLLNLKNPRLATFYFISKLFSKLTRCPLILLSENEIPKTKTPIANKELVFSLQEIDLATTQKKAINQSVRGLQNSNSRPTNHLLYKTPLTHGGARNSKFFGITFQPWKIQNHNSNNSFLVKQKNKGRSDAYRIFAFSKKFENHETSILKKMSINRVSLKYNQSIKENFGSGVLNKKHFNTPPRLFFTRINNTCFLINHFLFLNPMKLNDISQNNLGFFGEGLNYSNEIIQNQNFRLMDVKKSFFKDSQNLKANFIDWKLERFISPMFFEFAGANFDLLKQKSLIMLNKKPWQQDFIKNNRSFLERHSYFGDSKKTIDLKVHTQNHHFDENQLPVYNTIYYKPLLKFYSSQSFFGSNLGIATGYNEIVEKFKLGNHELVFSKNPEIPSPYSSTKKIPVPALETKLIRTQALHDSKPLQEMQYSLQKAVDALIDNSQKLQSNVLLRKGRPLKSLSDNLKGKEGRFRQHLLGKRVDYSGRSVIVVGPDLKLYECGIPLIMALRLFQPFLILYLIYRFKIASLLATQLIQRKHPMVINLLKKFIETWPIILNRAPTLHRMNIQAFKIRLVQGKAILLHPLVCSSYNADFDGDQMGVHVPITQEARAESWKLLWSINNSINIASRQPLFLPSQDMVIGNYYLTAPPIDNHLDSLILKKQWSLNYNNENKIQFYKSLKHIFEPKAHKKDNLSNVFQEKQRYLNQGFSNKKPTLSYQSNTCFSFSQPWPGGFSKMNHYFFSLEEAYQYYLNTVYSLHVNTPVWFRFYMVFETSEREKPIEITINKNGNTIYTSQYYEKQLKRNRILGKNTFYFNTRQAAPHLKSLITEPRNKQKLIQPQIPESSIQKIVHKKEALQFSFKNGQLIQDKSLFLNKKHTPIFLNRPTTQTNKAKFLKDSFINEISADTEAMILPCFIVFNKNLRPILLNQIIRSTFGRIEFYYEAFYASSLGFINNT